MTLSTLMKISDRGNQLDGSEIDIEEDPRIAVPGT